MRTRHKLVLGLCQTARALCAGGLLAISMLFSGATLAAAGDVDVSFSPSSGGKIFARLAEASGLSNGTMIALHQEGIYFSTFLVGGECGESFSVRSVCVGQFQTSPSGTNLSVTTFGVQGVAKVLTGWFDVSVRSLVVDSARRILVAGSCRSNVGNWQFCVTRLLANGTLDTSYGVAGVVTTDFATTSDDEILDAVMQPDGKLVVAGRCLFGVPASSSDYGLCLARYLSDGTLDNTFDGDGKVLTNVNSGRSDVANSVHLLADGKLLVSGSCTTATATVACVVRYLSNGTPDSAFGSAGVVTLVVGGSGGSDASALQPDRKLLLSVTCPAGFCALRMMADGSLDTGYGVAGLATLAITGTRGAVRLRIQHDGKAIIAGWCDQGATSIDFCVGRLHDSGQLDTSFGSNGQASVSFASGSWQDYLQAITISRDGKILLAGNCEDGAVAQYEACIVRLDGGSSAAQRCTLDLNIDGNTDALGDALILTRVLLGFTGQDVLIGTPNLVAPAAEWTALRDRLFYQCGLLVRP